MLTLEYLRSDLERDWADRC